MCNPSLELDLTIDTEKRKKDPFSLALNFIVNLIVSQSLIS